MTVESATYISQLSPTLPADGDDIPEGDNHIRLLKSVLQAQFTGLGTTAVSVTAAQINDVPNKSLRAGDTYTGSHDFTGATLTVAPATTGSQPYTKAQSDSLVISATAPTFTATSTATSKTLVAFEECAVTASGQTITLPASPTSGQTVCRIRTRSGISTTVGRNGKPIMGLAEDMTIPLGNITVTLGYHDATDGWILL